MVVGLVVVFILICGSVVMLGVLEVVDVGVDVVVGVVGVVVCVIIGDMVRLKLVVKVFRGRSEGCVGVVLGECSGWVCIGIFVGGF